MPFRKMFLDAIQDEMGRNKMKIGDKSKSLWEIQSDTYYAIVLIKKNPDKTKTVVKLRRDGSFDARIE